jgi:hypothetical protein
MFIETSGRAARNQRAIFMKMSLAAIVSASLVAGMSGCTVQYVNPPADAPPPPPTAYYDAPPDGPVVDDPSVVVIDEEPPPPERVYIYDPGYPPGTYFYGGFYYYGGYRYPHDVFVNRFVVVNVREHRYVDVEQNRRVGSVMVERQRADYGRTGGRHVAVRPAPRGGPGGPYGPDHGDHDHH